MNQILIALLKSVTALIMVINPMGLIPLFVTLTKEIDKTKINKILFKSCIVAFILITIFTIAGSWILSLFSVDIHDFLISGGILLLVISIRIILSSPEKSLDNPKFGIVPLATPMIVGPGVITVTLVLTQTTGIYYTLLSGIIALIITWVVLRMASYLFSLLGEEIMDIIARITGLLLAAISIRFIREGIISLMGK